MNKPGNNRESEVAGLSVERAPMTFAEHAEPTIPAGRRLPTVEEAYTMGAKGAPKNAEEQQLFEAYIEGRGWGPATWNEQQGSYEEMHARLLYAVWRDRAALGRQVGDTATPSARSARALGLRASGHNEAERRLFEAYMRGHCWLADGWNEKYNSYDPMRVQVLYMSWRDRAVLAARAERAVALKSAA